MVAADPDHRSSDRVGPSVGPRALLGSGQPDPLRVGLLESEHVIPPRTARRTVASGTVLVLAGAGLMASAPAAVAAELTTTYTCTDDSPFINAAGDYSGTVTVSIPASVESGTNVAARSLGLSVTIPDSTMDAVRATSAEELGATSDDVTYRVGATAYPVTGVILPKTAVPADGPLEIETTATASAFVAPAPGSYAVRVPEAFSLLATAYGTPIGNPTVTITCALAVGAPDTIATVQVTPAVAVASTTKGKVKNAPITTTKRAKVVATVRAPGRTPTGKVTAKLGKKKLASGALSGGKVTLKLPKLSKGKKTITLVYAGDAGSKKSKGSVTFTVKRG